jgi:hypothetical protein
MLERAGLLPLLLRGRPVRLIIANTRSRSDRGTVFDAALEGRHDHRLRFTYSTHTTHSNTDREFTVCHGHVIDESQTEGLVGTATSADQPL